MKQNSILYSAPYSTRMKIATIFIMVLFHGVFMFGMGGMRRHWNDWQPFSFYLIVFLLAVVWVLFCFAIQLKGTEVDDQQITIRRRVGNTVILRSDIQKVEPHTILLSHWRGAASLFLFGHNGSFVHPLWGRYTAWVKNPDRMVAIHTDKGTWVISCDDVAGFCENVVSKS